MQLRFLISFMPLVLLVGCATLSPAGEKVKVVNLTEVPEGCKNMGPVDGSRGYGPGGRKKEDLIVELRNAAAEKGANVVSSALIMSPDTAMSGKVQGTALQCTSAAYEKLIPTYWDSSTPLKDAKFPQ